MFNVRLAGGHLYGKQLFTWLSLLVSLMASFVLSFFQLDVLDEIWDLIDAYPFHIFIMIVICVTYIRLWFVFMYQNVYTYNNDVHISLHNNYYNLLLILHIIILILKRNVEHHFNYIMRICQHILDNVSFLGTARYVPAEKNDII